MAEKPVFGTFGRYTEPALEAMTVEQRAAYDKTVAARGQLPGPSKIWLNNPALERAMVPIGVYFQEHKTLSDAEREIVTNMVNGRWAAAAYSNHEHELIGTRAGLDPDDVAALIVGRPVSFGDPRRQVVHDVAFALVARRRLPRGLFDKAVTLLGHAGLADIAVLIGYFTSVSLTLVAYDVPSDATGLAR